MLSFIVVLSALLIAGCTTTRPSNYEEWVYPTLIQSEPAGARIEVNGEFIGSTPIQVVLPRMYRYGWVGLLRGGNAITWVDSMLIRAYATQPGQYTQLKYIKANQYPPREMHFDMRIQPAPTQVELDVRTPR